MKTNDGDFPNHVVEIINGKPGTRGLSNTDPTSPKFGITLKYSLDNKTAQ